MATTLTGNAGVIKVDASVGGSVAQIYNVRSFSIELTRDTIETSVMGSSTRTYVNGLSSWSGTADIYFDPTSSTGTLGAHPILNPTSGSVGASTLTGQFFLNDTAAKFEGELIITGLTINSSFDGLVEASISFQGSGAATYTA